ncbi:hypothetical protein VP06_14500 [Methylobacterium aquaticum]|uniref:Uncharacterized protein n=2 Tax=Methylobacterium aquaticum TaxID=270351 RepID=A0A0J6V5U5_9HYPH|nr:hypothetical protein VP06_14500 [Methylobacterium aquaticum]
MFGRYASRLKRNGPLIATAIYPAKDGSGIWVKFGHNDPFKLDTADKEEDFCEGKFAWFARNPVSNASYKTWMETGEWPNQAPQVSDRVQSNAPPEVMLRETLDELTREFDAWIASVGEIRTKDDGDKAADFKGRFSEIAKEAEELREEQKRPHVEAGRKVDGTWKPIVDDGKAAAKRAAAAAQSWLTFDRARKLREAAEAVEAGQAVKTEDLTSRAGTRGRQVSLRTTQQFTITDRAAMARYFNIDDRFLENGPVMVAVGKIALAHIEAGIAVPGAEMRAVTSAA